VYVCLWSPDWSTDGEPDAEAAGAASSGSGPDPEIAVLLAELAPRLRVDQEVVWADGRGLDAGRLAERLLERLMAVGVESRAGVAAVPVVAELAARCGPGPDGIMVGPTPFLVKERTGWGWRKPLGTSSTGAGDESEGPLGGVVEVPEGEERQWLEPIPVVALDPDPRIRTLLDGVGVHTLGDLAALEREAVEVRFGGEAVRLWRLARADDRRLLFERVPPERPHGSIDFVDYVLTDPSRLLFTANALLGPVCDRLQGRGEHARSLRLVLPLGNGETWERTIRPARPTASRETWLRLLRGVLDRLTVPDAVAGMRVEAPSTEPASVRQGDLFDRGFATASAVEAAVARLAERQVRPLRSESNDHPLPERRARWKAESIGEPMGAWTGSLDAPDGVLPAALGLQLLSEPRRLNVEVVLRRDHEVPVRLRDHRGWHEVLLAAGPDRISGGQWEESTYAREYYLCVTDEGMPLWVYRDGLDGAWYLQGYWD
jgi:protein ImuB